MKKEEAEQVENPDPYPDLEPPLINLRIKIRFAKL